MIQQFLQLLRVFVTVFITSFNILTVIMCFVSKAGIVWICFVTVQAQIRLAGRDRLQEPSHDREVQAPTLVRAHPVQPPPAEFPTLRAMLCRVCSEQLVGPWCRPCAYISSMQCADATVA